MMSHPRMLLVLLSLVNLQEAALILPIRYSIWRGHKTYNPYHPNNIRQNLFHHNHHLADTYSTYSIQYLVISANKHCRLDDITCVECEPFIQKHNEGQCPNQGQYLHKSYFLQVNSNCEGKWIAISKPRRKKCEKDTSFIFV